MTEDPTESSSNQTKHNSCPADTSEDIVDEEDEGSDEMKEFQWSKKLQGALLSSFFYGYIATQILGGYLSDKVQMLDLYL